MYVRQLSFDDEGKIGRQATATVGRLLVDVFPKLGQTGWMQEESSIHEREKGIGPAIFLE